MDAEDYIVDNMLATTDHSDEHKRDIRATYDKVHRLFVKASANRNLDNFFLTRDALNYCLAFGIPNTASVHSAGADYQTANLWTEVYNKTIKNAGLADNEKSFLHCLSYMLRVESLYGQIVDKICYLLVWQAKQPDAILGKNKNCCKRVDSVDEISTRCPLATKCEFLASKGFGDLADACDVDLRNAVAHTTAVIGEPTIRTTRNRTASTLEMRSDVSIEGTDISIRRRAKYGSYGWEKVDIEKTRHQLETAMWRYNVAFGLCDAVCTFATDPEFLCAMNNPDSPHTVTFSKGKVRLSWNNPNKSNQ